QIPLAAVLAVAFDAAARIGLAPSPLDAERERFRQRRERAIREIGIAFGKLPVQAIAISEGDVLHLGALAELRHDVVPEHASICRGWGRTQADKVLGVEPRGQIGDRRSGARGLDVGERITAEVDLAAQALRFIASLRRRPIGSAADREAAPATGPGRVIENERPRAGGGDPDAQAADDVVVVNPVAALGRRQALDHAVAEMGHGVLRVQLMSIPLMYGRVQAYYTRVQACQRKSTIFPRVIGDDRTKAVSLQMVAEMGGPTFEI